LVWLKVTEREKSKTTRLMLGTRLTAKERRAGLYSKSGTLDWLKSRKRKRKEQAYILMPGTLVWLKVTKREKSKPIFDDSELQTGSHQKKDREKSSPTLSKPGICLAVKERRAGLYLMPGTLVCLKVTKREISKPMFKDRNFRLAHIKRVKERRAGLHV
jgi:hypothetical protein